MLHLRTPRLILRDVVVEDTALIGRMAHAPAITRYQSLLRLDSEVAIDRWVQNVIYHNNQQPRRAYNLTVVESQEKRGIGWIGWGHAEDPTHGEYSFGYALLPEYWGQGYMTEALRAGLTFMFETLGAHGISAYCEAANLGSMRVMEKVGMRLVAHWSEEDTPGMSVGYRRYAIERAEWTAQGQGEDRSSDNPGDMSWVPPTRG